MSGILSIEDYVDFICSWCLIGKLNLAQALVEFRRQYPGTPVHIDWRPHELLPGPHSGGVALPTRLPEAAGQSALAVEARRAQVRHAAEMAGKPLPA